MDVTKREKALLDVLLMLCDAFLFVAGASGVWDARRIWRQAPGGILDVDVARMVIWDCLLHGVLPALALAWSLPLLFVPVQKLIARAWGKGASLFA